MSKELDPNASTIPFTVSEDKGQKPVLNEVRPVGVWAYHALRAEDGKLVEFNQHVEAAKQCAGFMLEEFKAECEAAPATGGVDLTQPFCLQAALVCGDTEAGNFMEKLVVRSSKKMIAFHEDRDSVLADFLNTSLPKLLWAMRMSLGAKKKQGKLKKATHIAFYFEFSMRQTSATLDQLRKVIQKKQDEKAKTASKSPIITLV